MSPRNKSLSVHIILSVWESRCVCHLSAININKTRVREKSEKQGAIFPRRVRKVLPSFNTKVDGCLSVFSTYRVRISKIKPWRDNVETQEDATKL